MLTSTFDYQLPKEAIAQVPAEPRDSSKLMVVDRKDKTTQDRNFSDIGEYLGTGDLLVWNNTKVFKARLRGQITLDEAADGIDKKIKSTDKIWNSAPVEIFLIRPTENNKVWKVLAKPGKKLRLGMKVVFTEDFFCEVLLGEDDGTFLVQFDDDDMAVRAKANKYGEVPTPPYISVGMGDNLEDKYQTVYASREGSVAAPTAGFHFTPELIEKLEKKGVQFAEVTLHVGLGTFLPVKTEKVEDHKMHSEWVEVTAKNVDLINQAKAEGRRVVAVGTTTVRTLEGIVMLQKNMSGTPPQLKPYSGDINIFITPGFEFKVVDVLITNFHLPKSTLLMLVSAFVGDTQFILNCYQKAINFGYRFYSFGDAMLIK
ncbi:MAG: tRNA preQ1(34) S-adenosylmethionine ribosyltransferase-isomerase QueA [Patescibacteria group bacterium]